MTDFMVQHSFDERVRESTSVLEKYPERIPIIVQSRGGIVLDKIKYLVPKDLTIGQFVYVLRKRIKLTPEKGLFIFVDKTVPMMSCSIGEIYFKHANKDKFLYLEVSEEGAFGSF